MCGTGLSGAGEKGRQVVTLVPHNRVVGEKTWESKREKSGKKGWGGNQLG